MKFGLKRICGAVLTGCSLLSVGNISAGEHEALFAFAGQVSQHILAQQYQELSQLHHYPGPIAPAFAGENLCHVEHNLRDLVDQFGELQSMRPLAERVMFMGLGSGNGFEEYWQQQPGAYTFTYQAKFKKAGMGILKLEVINFTEKPRLKSIHFGLPASEAAMSRLQDMASEVTHAREQREESHACQTLIQS
ncbi:hypothetical protein ACFL2V_04990 [Pseudomonadota bacterium]